MKYWEMGEDIALADGVLEEEKDIITESGLKDKDVSQSIAVKAKDWYLSQSNMQK